MARPRSAVKGMSDVIEVSMTELDRAYGMRLMGQVCDERGSALNFLDQVPQPDREMFERWPFMCRHDGMFAAATKLAA
ncbi:hypothetical protein CO675_03940 [Bradyrhizobium sp. C9]|nr:hypothetical protein CO675_03940 [Bradyrhizobium sp. C9]